MLSSALPVPALRACVRAFAALQFRWSPGRRDAVLANLERIAEAGHPLLADPPARRLAARRMFEAHQLGWIEYLGRTASRKRAAEYRLSGTEHLYRAVAGGRGAVLSVPHLGNWELIGLALTRLGFQVHTVTGIQIHPSVTREVRALKERDGVRVSTPEDGFLPLVAALRSGGIVALMADGDVFSRSLPAEFFGRRVEFPAGPAILARRARVPIVHGHAVRTETGRHYISFDGVDEPDLSLALRDDLSRLTARVARTLERSIAAHVTQWCIFRPLWNSDAG
jgi:KDO2-lipid IV(A) lauroyltransferase